MTRLLLVGVAGMDWAGFEARTRSGGLPQLAALRARGVAGWLAGAPLSDGPAAWASLATGVEPEVHQVWRTQEAWPGGLRPTSRASWRAESLWARLETAGVATGSVAWPASRPGADWAGLHLDDRFPESTGRRPEDWALPRRCLPEALRETLRDRRVHVARVTGDMLAPLVPELATTDDPDSLTTIALGMAQAATIQSAAVWMLDGGAPGAPPDAVFIHHPWLGQMRLAFEGRRQGGLAAVLPAAWRFLDGLLGRLAALAGEDTLVLLVSPGWRSAPGVVLAVGAGVSRDADFQGAALLDIAPTALGRFNLEDPALPGRRIACLGDAGPFVEIPVRQGEAPIKADAVPPELLGAPGYRTPPGPSRAWRAQGAADLALMMLQRDPAGAATVAARALADDPANILALRVIGVSHVRLNQADALPDLADRLLKVAPESGWGSLARGAYHVLRGERTLAGPWLLKAEKDADPEVLLSVAAVWLAASRPASAERVFKAILAIDPANVAAEIGAAMGALGRRDFMAAETGLLRAMKHDPGRPAIYLQLAQTYARTARKTEAARAADMAQRLGAAPAMAAAARAGRLRG